MVLDSLAACYCLAVPPCPAGGMRTRTRGRCIRTPRYSLGRDALDSGCSSKQNILWSADCGVGAACLLGACSTPLLPLAGQPYVWPSIPCRCVPDVLFADLQSMPSDCIHAPHILLQTGPPKCRARRMMAELSREEQPHFSFRFVSLSAADVQGRLGSPVSLKAPQRQKSCLWTC